MSPILVRLTSHNDSDFESSNVSLKENKPAGVNPNSNDIDYYVRENEGKILWFLADCTVKFRILRHFLLVICYISLNMEKANYQLPGNDVKNLQTITKI